MYVKGDGVVLTAISKIQEKSSFSGQKFISRTLWFRKIFCDLKLLDNYNHIKFVYRSNLKTIMGKQIFAHNLIFSTATDAQHKIIGKIILGIIVSSLLTLIEIIKN